VLAEQLSKVFGKIEAWLRTTSKPGRESNRAIELEAEHLSGRVWRLAEQGTSRNGLSAAVALLDRSGTAVAKHVPAG